MANYNLEQLVGKNLYAQKNIPILARPTDKKPIRTISAGNLIGTLYSWIIDKKTNEIYFMFYNGKVPFYVKHVPNSKMIDVKKLVTQGAKSDEELQAAKEDKSKSTVEKLIKKYGIYIIGFAGLLLLTRKK
jgi:hypothetical protein